MSSIQFILQESLKGDINMDVMLKDLEKVIKIFIEHYKENEEKALMFKMNNTFEFEVNWKEQLAEGRERRRIIDMELYRNTSRIERYHKAKQDLKAEQEHREKLEALQEIKGESGKQGASRKGDSRQKKTSQPGQKSGKRAGCEKI
jgi:hypothetical protein